MIFLFSLQIDPFEWSSTAPLSFASSSSTRGRLFNEETIELIRRIIRYFSLFHKIFDKIDLDDFHVSSTLSFSNYPSKYVYIYFKTRHCALHSLFSLCKYPVPQSRYDLPPLNGQLTYSSSGNNDVLSCLAALLLLMGLQPLRGYRSQPNYDL